MINFYPNKSRIIYTTLLFLLKLTFIIPKGLHARLNANDITEVAKLTMFFFFLGGINK